MPNRLLDDKRQTRTSLQGLQKILKIGADPSGDLRFTEDCCRDLRIPT